jgi:hypothetical protein
VNFDLEKKTVKLARFAIAFLVIFLSLSALCAAQARFDGYFGLGSAQVGASKSLGTGAPSMVGVFGTLGGALMLEPTLGVGGEVSFRFAQGNYLGYGYRPVFYDFNGIFTPALSKRFMPEFQAGFGGVSLRFYDASNPYYDYNTGRYTTFAGSFNHFQLHAGAGLRFNVKRHMFVRPQVDYHWVPNLEQFGSNSVFAYSVAIGFSSAE